MPTRFEQQDKKTTYAADNAYTLSATTLSTREFKSDNAGDRVFEEEKLTRTFNFLAEQVTTTKSKQLFQSRGGHAGGFGAVTEQTIVQNFQDIQSPAEIEHMRSHLRSIGGQPPESAGARATVRLEGK